MSKILDYIKDKDFAEESEGDPFPEGQTEIDLTKVDVEERKQDFGEGPKLRYLLKYNDKNYWAGPQILAGIKLATESGFTKVVIQRKGTGLKTKYTVMGKQD